MRRCTFAHRYGSILRNLLLKKTCFVTLSVLFCRVLFAQSAPPVDTTQPAAVKTASDSLFTDTTTKNISSTATTDSLPSDSSSSSAEIADSLQTDTLKPATFSLPDTTATLKSSSIDTPPIDTTTINNGLYFSAGIGWSLGGFTLLKMWENALPDSLGGFELTDSSFQIVHDSTEEETPPNDDIAKLSFSIKEKPAIYTMSFPLTLSIVRLSDKNRLSFSLYGSWMRKVFTATIAATGDSLERKIDYEEAINIYSAYLSCALGFQIPEEYFSIEAIERTFFMVGIDISPIIACTIHRKVTAPSTDERLVNIQNHISSPERRFLRGGSAALRLGMSMMKRLNKRTVTDFSIWYSLQWYGYFYEKGDRTTFKDIDPEASKKGHNLSWISNRFEIAVSLMRRREK